MPVAIRSESGAKVAAASMRKREITAAKAVRSGARLSPRRGHVFLVAVHGVGQLGRAKLEGAKPPPPVAHDPNPMQASLG